MKKMFFLAFLFGLNQLTAQPNCEAYKYLGDTLKYKACLKTEKAKGLYQFSMKYQGIMDEALEIDPSFDYAYWAKSIAYLKSGDFLTWKKLIDKAVKYNPEEHLGYRGWCRYQFFRDYEGAIRDLETLEQLVDYDIGMCQNGAYHLNVARGLFYKGIGQAEKALSIIESQVEKNEKNDMIGGFDYLHLGVLYLEKQAYQKAILKFKKQAKINDLAENHYYMALAYFQLENMTEYLNQLKTSKALYVKGLHMYDDYSNPMDSIFLEDINEELKRAEKL